MRAWVILSAMASTFDFGSLPEKFVTNVRATFGVAGETLLRELPSILDECKIRWDLELFRHFPNLSYNYVAPGRLRDGTAVVLKIGVPSNKELLTEIEALRAFGGRGMARLLEAAPERGAFLLERIVPGASLLLEGDDALAARIAASVMRDFRPAVPARHSFPSVARWFEALNRLRQRFEGGSGPLPASLVSLAEELLARLLASASADVLLHGDLHQDNILFSQRLGWVAIDPKGLVGEPCYEVGAFLRNPQSLFQDSARALSTSERRLGIFSEALGFDPARMAAWTVAQAMLSGCWCLEDSVDGWEGDMACAETFARLL